MRHLNLPGDDAVSGGQLLGKALERIQPRRYYHNNSSSARRNDIEDDVLTTCQSLLKVCCVFSSFWEVEFCIRSRRRRSWCMVRRGWQHHIEPFNLLVQATVWPRSWRGWGGFVLTFRAWHVCEVGGVQY